MGIARYARRGSARKFHLREQQVISAQGLDSRRPEFVDVPSLGNSRVENTTNK
jgi:hypothetical protein